MSVPYNFNRGEIFTQALSDFWITIFQDAELIKAFISGYGENFSQAYFNFLESVLGQAVRSIPVFHKEKWYFLTFKESELSTTGSLEYGDDALYGPQDGIFYEPGRIFEYGEQKVAKFRFNLPVPMVDIKSYITNRISVPSLVLTKEKDFTIYNGRISFVTNPFSDSRFAKRDIIGVGGKVIDREIGMWALNSDWDYDLLWKHYGQLVGVKRVSSEIYRRFLQAIWKLQVVGPAGNTLDNGINAILGLPVAREDEVLQTVVERDTYYTLLTDKNSYSFPNEVPLNSTFFKEDGSFEYGKKIKQFSPLTDIAHVYDAIRKPRWWRDVSPLIIPGYLIRPRTAEFKEGDRWEFSGNPVGLFNIVAADTNSSFKNAIDLDVSKTFGDIDPFKYSIIVTTPGVLGTAVLEFASVGATPSFMLQTVKDVTEYDLPLVGPFKLLVIEPSLEERLQDFIVPEVEIRGTNIIGDTFGLDEADAPNEFFEEIGLRVGSFEIGEGPYGPLSIRFDFKDFIMENFFGRHLFFITVHEAAISAGYTNGDILNLISETIPAYTTFISALNIPKFEDDYTVTEQEEELEVNLGITLNVAEDEGVSAYHELRMTYVPAGNDLNRFSLKLHPLTDTLVADVDYRLKVTTAGTLGTAVLQLRLPDNTVIATIPTVASQTFYEISQINSAIEVVGLDTDTFRLNDIWIIVGFGYDDADILGYVDGVYGEPIIGFLNIGDSPIVDPYWVVGGPDAFYPTIHVTEQCLSL